MKTPVVCFDLDGVIATGTVQEVYSDEAGWAYEKCTPIESTIDLMQYLRNQGVCIIIHTARPESDLRKTASWLRKHDVVFDKLVMGKPYAHVYIDDRNFPVPFDPMAESIKAPLMKKLEEISRFS